MRVTRRRAMELLGSALATPYLLKTDRAAAATFVPIGQPRRVDRGAEQDGGLYRAHVAAFDAPGSGFMITVDECCRAAQPDPEQFRPLLLQERRAAWRACPARRRKRRSGSEGGGDPYPVTFSDGTSLALFSAYPRDGGTSYDLFAERFTAQGEKIGLPKRVYHANDRTQWRAIADRLPNQNAIAAWIDQGIADSASNPRGRVLDSRADGVHAVERITEASPESETIESLAALNNGRAVLSYVVGGEETAVVCSGLPPPARGLEIR